jgi:beta-N-acetylhexosaminidase
MPASISKPIIQGLLRDQLGYKGIVITDDLDMGAISKYYSFDKLGYAALNAGADILLVCHEYSHQLEMYNGIINAVDTGLITENRIDESVRRVLTFKLTNLSSSLVSESHAEQVVRSTKHLDILSEFNKKVE